MAKSMGGSSERQLVQNFISHNQSTHKGVVSNSVGMLLLTLYKNYLGGQKLKDDYKMDEKNFLLTVAKQTAAHVAADDKIEDEFKLCIQQLRTTAMLPLKKLAALDNTQPAKELEPSKAELDPQKEAAINYICGLAYQRLDIFDALTISFLTDAIQPLSEKNITEESHLFPLKLVLVLTWKAINDNSHYLQHYTGSHEEKLKAAEAEKNERINTFFNNLINIHRIQVCHQGNRNELAFTLNKIYADVDLIEDQKATIWAILKDAIYASFKKISSDEKLSADTKQKFFPILLKWLATGNATEIFNHLENHKQITDSIFELFIKNGSNPFKLKLEDTISEALTTLEFSGHPKEHPLLYKIQRILTYVDDGIDPNKSLALKNIKAWLLSCDFTQKENQDKILGFYTMFELANFLKSAKPLMILAGNLPDNYTELEDDCKKYFNACKNTPDYSVPQAMLTKKENFDNLLINSKLNNLSDQIENFFNHWFAAKNEGVASKQRIYAMLLSEHFTDKVIIKDEDIKGFFSESKEYTGEIAMRPYIFNRMFLHAILIPPADWSPLFTQAFKVTLAFVKNKFNQPEIGVAANLSRDSYPEDLIKQLEYLLSKRTSINSAADEKIIERPNSMLLLPRDASTMHDLLLLEKRAGKESFEKIYSVYAAKFMAIQEIFFRETYCLNAGASYHKAMSDYLENSIPKNYRLSFLKMLYLKNAALLNFTDNLRNLIDLVSTLPEHHKSIFLGMLNPTMSDTPVNLTTENLKILLLHLPDDKKINFLLPFVTSIRDPFFSFYPPIENANSDWESLLLLLPDNDKIEFLHKLIQPSFIKANALPNNPLNQLDIKANDAKANVLPNNPLNQLDTKANDAKANVLPNNPLNQLDIKANDTKANVLPNASLDAQQNLVCSLNLLKTIKQPIDLKSSPALQKASENSEAGTALAMALINRISSDDLKRLICNWRILLEVLTVFPERNQKDILSKLGNAHLKKLAGDFTDTNYYPFELKLKLHEILPLFKDEKILDSFFKTNNFSKILQAFAPNNLKLLIDLSKTLSYQTLLYATKNSEDLTSIIPFISANERYSFFHSFLLNFNGSSPTDIPNLVHALKYLQNNERISILESLMPKLSKESISSLIISIEKEFSTPLPRPTDDPILITNIPLIQSLPAEKLILNPGNSIDSLLNVIITDKFCSSISDWTELQNLMRNTSKQSTQNLILKQMGAKSIDKLAGNVFSNSVDPHNKNSTEDSLKLLRRLEEAKLLETLCKQNKINISSLVSKDSVKFFEFFQLSQPATRNLLISSARNFSAIMEHLPKSKFAKEILASISAQEFVSACSSTDILLKTLKQLENLKKDDELQEVFINSLSQIDLLKVLMNGSLAVSLQKIELLTEVSDLSKLGFLNHNHADDKQQIDKKDDRSPSIRNQFLSVYNQGLLEQEQAPVSPSIDNKDQKLTSIDTPRFIFKRDDPLILNRLLAILKASPPKSRMSLLNRLELKSMLVFYHAHNKLFNEVLATLSVDDRSRLMDTFNLIDALNTQILNYNAKPSAKSTLRDLSIKTLQKSIDAILINLDLTHEAKLAKIIAQIKGHIEITLTDHTKGLFGNYKPTKSGLAGAYQKALAVLLEKEVSRIPADKICLEDEKAPGNLTITLKKK